MDQSIWDDEEDYIDFGDNEETCIWEDLRPKTKSPSSTNRNHSKSINKGDGNQLSFAFEELRQSDQRDSKKSYYKINKTNRLSVDRLNKELFREDMNSSQLLKRTFCHNSNASGRYSPIHLSRRSSRANSNASNGLSPQIHLRTSRSNSNVSNGFSPRVGRNPKTRAFSPRVSRCNSGARSPSTSAGRIANGPDGTIGFHKGRAGECLRERKDQKSLSRAFAAISFLEEIEDNQRIQEKKSWPKRSSSAQLLINPRRLQEQQQSKNTKRSSGLRRISPRASSRTRIMVTPESGINKSSPRKWSFKQQIPSSSSRTPVSLRKDIIKSKKTTSLTMAPRRLSENNKDNDEKGDNIRSLSLPGSPRTPATLRKPFSFFDTPR